MKKLTKIICGRHYCRSQMIGGIRHEVVLDCIDNLYGDMRNHRDISAVQRGLCPLLGGRTAIFSHVCIILSGSGMAEI